MVCAAVLALECSGAQAPASITVDYPMEGSIFPPDLAPPTFLWRDPAKTATRWTVEVQFAGSPRLRAEARGERMKVGEIDRRCVSATNQLPKLTPEQAAARTWIPDAETWAAIKKNSVQQPAVLIVTGYAAGAPKTPVSRGRVSVRTSADPVGAPIFYRDVPLMPSETEKGVIKPLAANMVPLIAWRLRDVSQPASRVLMTGIHSCANCHSFSRDGKTMGMDVDGPLNDKGLYALMRVEPKTMMASENVIAWSTFRGKLGGKLRVGFMSQVSPDGSRVITTINEPEEEQTDYQRRKLPKDLVQNYYVANFKDYRFLQVFYPTRGILAWYNRETGRLEHLPGADDPRYVHTNAVWSPDGKYIVFARAEARDAYTPGTKMAERANDPAETQIQYDLYRIPFNNGKGGVAEAITGASRNGMSNSFPKVSPDGRWIVFVKARNGQLMRPDSKLYIVPATGGEARPLRSNLPLMNSWHSFSPNGRWLVFSSKTRSPYTQMYLTHIDEEGNASPAILIENSTAANRAVNIPEFVNVQPGGFLAIDAPVTEYYRAVDVATDLAKKGEHEAAVAEWKRALQLGTPEAKAYFNLGNALAETGKADEAIASYQKAIELSPDHAEAQNNLGNALVGQRRLDEAIPHFEKALQVNPDHAGAHSNLGSALAQKGRLDEAIPHFERSVELSPEAVDTLNNLAVALLMKQRFADALPHLEKALKLSGGKDPMILDLLAHAYAGMGRFREAIESARGALDAATARNNRRMIESLKLRIAAYEAELAGK